MAQFRWNPIYGKFDLVDNAPSDGSITTLVVDDEDLSTEPLVQPNPQNVTAIAGLVYLSGENGLKTYKLTALGANISVVAFNHGEVQTIGATTESILTFPTTIDTSFRIQILLSGTADDGSAVGGNNYYTVKNIGGVLSIIEEPDLILDKDSPLDAVNAFVAASGTDFVVYVTGVIGRTINWEACTPGVIQSFKP